MAKLTGQTTAQVYTQRAAGKSFADIASAKGISADKVASDALAARKTALAAAVKAGTITQAQADTMLARMQTPHLASASPTRLPPAVTAPARAPDAAAWVAARLRLAAAAAVSRPAQ